MSDFILKFWPEEETQEEKTELIKQELQKDQIVSEKVQHWGKPAFKAGERLGEMIGITNEGYVSQLKVQVEEVGYGVEQGAEDFEYIDRKNVVCIHNGDGEIENWSKLESYLTSLTKQKYKGGWELL